MCVSIGRSTVPCEGLSKIWYHTTGTGERKLAGVVAPVVADMLRPRQSSGVNPSLRVTRQLLHSCFHVGRTRRICAARWTLIKRHRQALYEQCCWCRPQANTCSRLLQRISVTAPFSSQSLAPLAVLWRSGCSVYAVFRPGWDDQRILTPPVYRRHPGHPAMGILAGMLARSCLEPLLPRRLV
jgi:hypothetical protein